MQNGWAIDIDRDDITTAVLVEEAPATLSPGQIRVAIDLYAMTANNITYAVFGKPSGLFGNDQGYWDFFAERDAPGRLPVWGFATVTSMSSTPILATETHRIRTRSRSGAAWSRVREKSCTPFRGTWVAAISRSKLPGFEVGRPRRSMRICLA